MARTLQVFIFISFAKSQLLYFMHKNHRQGHGHSLKEMNDVKLFISSKDSESY